MVTGNSVGQKLSCLFSNIVITRKHYVWRMDRDNPSNNVDLNDNTGQNGIVFRYPDSRDLRSPILATYGYCDDNNKGCRCKKCRCIVEGLDELVEYIKHQIRRTSQFSLVTRIARNGPKSELHILNLTPKQIIVLSKMKFYCFEWDMERQRPVKREFMVRMLMRKNAADFAESPEELQEAMRLEYKKPFKLLGIRKTLSGDTTNSGEVTTNKTIARIKKVGHSSISPLTARLAINILGTSVMGFEPLLNRVTIDQANNIDKTILGCVSRVNGYSKSDAKQLIFADTKVFGHGHKSAVMLRLQMLASCLEIISNQPEVSGGALRARIEAKRRRSAHDEKIDDTVTHAVLTLGAFGLMFRDRQHVLANEILEQLLTIKSLVPLGMEGFRGKRSSTEKKRYTGPLIGSGNKQFERYALEEGVQKTIQLTIDKVLEDDIDPMQLSNPNIWTKIGKPEGISAHNVAKASAKAFTTIENNAAAMYDGILEWRATENDNDFRTSLDWRPLSISRDCRRAAKDPTAYAEDCRREYLRRHRLNPRNDTPYEINGKIKPSDRQILDDVHAEGSPLFLFTDGGHIDTKKATRPEANSAAMAICKPDIRDEETFKDRKWEGRVMIPVLVRIMIMPNNLGAHQTDNGHAEMVAMSMAEESLPTNLPAVILTDSLVTMAIYRILREGTIGSQRNLVRKLMNTSKACVMRLLTNIAEWSEPARKALRSQVYEQEVCWEHEDPQEQDLDDILDNYFDEYGDLIVADGEGAQSDDEEERWDTVELPSPPPARDCEGSLRTDLADLPEYLGAAKSAIKTANDISEKWISEKYKERYRDNHLHRPIGKVDSRFERVADLGIGQIQRRSCFILRRDASSTKQYQRAMAE